MGVGFGVVSNYGLVSKFELDLLRNRTNVQKLRDNFDRCCNAIRATVDFLTQHCWIHNADLLGGRAALVPLVYYFFQQDKHRIPKSQIPRARLALYWFGFSRAFSRYGDSRAGAFIRDELKARALNGDSSFPSEQATAWVRHWEGFTEFGAPLLQRNATLALHLVQDRTGTFVQHAAATTTCLRLTTSFLALRSATRDTRKASLTTSPTFGSSRGKGTVIRATHPLRTIPPTSPTPNSSERSSIARCSISGDIPPSLKSAQKRSLPE